MTPIVKTSIGSLYESGWVKPHAEFFMCAALRREIRAYLHGNADPNVTSAMIKLAFPDIGDGGRVKASELRFVLERIHDELTDKMIEMYYKDDSNYDNVIASFRSQKYNTIN